MTWRLYRWRLKDQQATYPRSQISLNAKGKFYARVAEWRAFKVRPRSRLLEPRTRGHGVLRSMDADHRRIEPLIARYRAGKYLVLLNY